ncbi:putative mucin/carbohydrate-binding domain-containing protein [Lysinibacter sp. HNR]|uniref:putative mucin/carbohydrate-binding domain-containing protein n=1 Tax=Lysinibacter sp. HNR TaxID=3031408 RepID=UPI0024355DA1|nr:putative mucin/carbohydrate-binding domain-containing protein [Lysinibacter sp. HNR]WGD36868.1 putative mucin/carbohydrate-binding domain-containing protein [Lysinibacter sp. HNR]
MKNTQGIPNALTSKIDVERGTTLDLLGISDHSVATITLNPTQKTIQTQSNTDAWSHDYFKDKDYIRFSLFDVDASPIKNITIQGQNSGRELQKILDGHTYSDGQFIQIFHAEPRTRLARYDNNTPTQPSTAQAQAQNFIIRKDRLIPTTEIKPFGGTSAAVNLLGSGDRSVATVILNPSTGKIQAKNNTHTWSNIYFKDQDYIRFSLFDVDASPIKNITIQGQNSGQELQKILDGQAYSDGQFIQIFHAEPQTRLMRYDNGTPTEYTPAQTQNFVIREDRLIPTTEIDILP